MSTVPKNTLLSLVIDSAQSVRDARVVRRDLLRRLGELERPFPQPSKYQVNRRRLMISRIISEVPEAMVHSRTSRKKRSTGSSRM